MDDIDDAMIDGNVIDEDMLLTEKPDKAKVGRPKGAKAKKAADPKKSSLGESNADLAYMGSRDEAADGRTIASRARIRSKVDEDIEAFIASGGAISHIKANVTADPPKKPTSNYGGRAI
jgi:hypothetical protein